MGKVDGRVALVTGAASGMGAAHAELLAREGAQVVVTDVADAEGVAHAKRIDATFHRLDVTDEGSWGDVVATVTADLGPISILVNNAGVPGLNRVQDTPTEEWSRIMAVNLTGVFLGIRTIVPSMRQAGGGVIVNVSSDVGMIGMPHMAAYATSKWAVRGLTKAAALDLAVEGIRVLSLHPGIVRTPMGERSDMDAIAKGQPMHRVGEPEELAAMLLFMVADATYSTGTEFVADGGHSVGSNLPI